MRAVKPHRLGLTTRVVSHGSKHVLAITVSAGFDLTAPHKRIDEAEVYQALSHVPDQALLDEGAFKPRGELLVSGSAHAPKGEPVESLPVRVSLGSIQRELLVTGDRKLGTTAAFTEIPVSWERSGRWPRGESGGEGNVACASGGPPGMRAIPRAWPQRCTHQGRYDADWMANRFPALPDETSLELFMMAPQAQRLDEGYFRGDEHFVIDGMHPEHPRLQGQLPPRQARIFLRRRGRADLEELRPVLDTVHLLPSSLIGVLVFRGVTEVGSADAYEIELVLAALETATEARSADHYAQALAHRENDEWGHLTAIEDADLLPTEEVEALDLNAGESSLLGQHLDRRAEEELEASRARLEQTRAELKAQGIDLPEVDFPSADEEPRLPTVAELPTFVDEIRKQAQEEEARLETYQAEAEQRARQACAEAGVDYDAVVAEAERDRGGPPKFRADAMLEQLREQQTLAANANMALPQIDALLEDPALAERLRETEASLREAYQRFAHAFPPAAALEPEEAKSRGDELLARLRAGESLQGEDFTGADLGGAELSKHDLSGVFLERARLTGAKLTGATLEGAVLTRADLSGANLEDANLHQANLGETDLRGSTLCRANLRGATLGQAQLAGADLSEAILEGADLFGCRLAGATIHRARFGEARFIDAPLEGIQAEGADMNGCVFVGCNLRDANLRGARLEEAVFVSCRGRTANFRNIQAARAVIGHDCDFTKADFRGAQLPRAGLMRGCFDGADFSGALLDGANLDGASAREASFYRAVAKHSHWQRTDLSKANLTASNLMLATFDHTNVASARFIGANLYGADLIAIQGDDSTAFTDALLDRAKLVKATGGLKDLSP